MLTSASISPANQRDLATAVANAEEHPLFLTYQGWSGFLLRVPSAPDAAVLALDPAPDVALPAEELTITITHGHPEHVVGTAAHLKRSDRASVTVVASKHVCRYLQRRSANADDRFVRADAGDNVEVRGWRLRVFEWQHMQLLPPGLAAKIAHLWRLISHPVHLTRIALESLGGPRHHPMLGFHITAPASDATLLYYGEGLHRRTSTEELQGALGTPPATTLLAGIEPEDEERIPELLGESYRGRAILFEPHKGWRSNFKMKQVDMPHLLARLNEAGMQAIAPPPGTNLTLVR